MSDYFILPWNITCDNLKEFVNKIYYDNIGNVTIDEDKQESIINFIPRNSNNNNFFTIIPNQMKAQNQNKSIYYGDDKTYQINDFPAITKFIETYCPHIKKFIDEENIKEVSISTVETFTGFLTNLSISNKLEKIELKKQFLKSPMVSILVLINIIQKFYFGSDNDQFNKPFKFDDHNHTNTILREKQLFNIIDNPMSILETYKIIDDGQCINRYGEMRAFNFANKQLFSTSNIEPYKKLIEIRLLDYIAHR